MDLQELCQVVPKAVSDWLVADVANWLQYIGLHRLVPSFQSNRIEGWQLLLLQEQDLIDTFERKKLLNWVSFLYENSRLLDSMVKGYNRVQGMRAEDNLLGSTTANTQLSLSLEGGEEIVNWGQFDLTRQSNFSNNGHRNLYIYERFGGNKRFYFCNRGRDLTIGKAASNTIPILDPHVDLQHCSIIHNQQKHYLHPGSSQAGVWFKIKNPLPIDRLYTIEMGCTLFTFDTQDQILVIVGFDDFSNLRHHGAWKYAPEKEIVKIGRSHYNDLSFGYDSTMSSMHAKISFVEGTWYFEDFSTTNGSWFKCVKETLLSDKSTFRITRSQFIFDCKLLQSDDGTTVSSSRSTGVCCRCKAAERNSYFTPCAHSNCCMECAKHSANCLQCHRAIAKIHKFYR